MFIIKPTTTIETARLQLPHFEATSFIHRFSQTLLSSNIHVMARASIVQYSLLVLLALTIRKATSFVSVQVELFPTFDSTPTPSCTSEFIDEFESSLTSIVVNVTQRVLSDFTIPGGLYLTYFSNATSQRRRDLKKTSTTCVANSAVPCAYSVGLGTCSFCQDTRRRAEKVTITGQEEGDDATYEDGQRLLQADWNVFGLDVSDVVEPLVQAYVADSAGADGCLGEPSELVVNVTFASDVPFSVELEEELIRAFDVPPEPAFAPTPRACCSVNFVMCDWNCATEAACQTCPDTGATWLPQGVPSNPYVCISRGNSCLNYASGCCKGLTCVGDQFNQLCIYPGTGPTPAPSPTSAPTVIPTSLPTRAPTHLPTVQPTMLPTPPPTSLPTPLPTRLPTLLPTPPPTPLPTRPPTPPPSQPPTPQPTKQPTRFPTPRPTQACLARGSSCAYNGEPCCSGASCKNYMIFWARCQ